MKKLIAPLLFSALGAISLSANAAVVEGTLYAVNDDSGARIGSTVDHWSFSTTGGLVTIDTLSMEYGANGYTDVNGDGEIAYFDPYIHLFRDDGSLDAGDLLASNDDSGATFSDGSIHGYDSYLSVNLAAGDYILAIGSFFLSVDDAINQLNRATYYPVCDTGQCDHGDYQITFTNEYNLTGPSADVPEPSTLALLGLGMAGLAFTRRRKLSA